MKDSAVIVDLAEKDVGFRLHRTGTELWFRRYEDTKSDPRCIIDWFSAADRSIEEHVQENRSTPEFAEFSCLMELAADYLTRYDRVLFHGVAFLHNRNAYLLTAPSGTGKSTQFRNLKRLFGDCYRIICGDKPVLWQKQEGVFEVYPSPWNGKEGWGSLENGPLKAIIVLEQGDRNALRVLNPEGAALPVLEQIICSAPDLDTVRRICAFAEQLIENVQIFSFVNKGDVASSIMLDKLIEKLENRRDVVCCTSQSHS